MTIDSADDSKILNRTINTNRITKLRRSLINYLGRSGNNFFNQVSYDIDNYRYVDGVLLAVLTRQLLVNRLVGYYKIRIRHTVR